MDKTKYATTLVNTEKAVQELKAILNKMIDNY
jgi:hypothetical protein